MIFRLDKSLLPIFFFILLLSSVAPAGGRALIGFGDSLMAGYGLAPRDGFMPQLERALRARGYDLRFVNASVSGDTTDSGRARLIWTLDGIVQTKSKARDIVILGLGGNDVLRGVSPARTRENLEVIIETLQTRGFRVFLAGMRSPLNWGADYAQDFDAIYPSLAKAYQIPLYPFFLDGVATVPRLNLSDGIHPNSQGIKMIVERILPFIEATLNR